MIDKSAIIHPKAELDKSVSVGPYAIIEEAVRLDRGVCVCSHAVIKGKTSIGENTFIGTGAIIGEAPQMFGSTANTGVLTIGRNNIIREYVTIHTSTGPTKTTCLGDNNFLMGFSHVAHDCKLADRVVLCNGALLAGHVEVGSSAFISGNVVVHQFVRIGRLSMVGGLSRVNQDVPPFMMVVGDSRVWGLNLVGLKRAGISPDERKDIKKAFELLYRRNLSQKNAVEELEKINSPCVREISVFVSSSQRGICGPQKSSFWEKLFLDYPYLVRSNIPVYFYFRNAARNLQPSRSHRAP